MIYKSLNSYFKNHLTLDDFIFNTCINNNLVIIKLESFNHTNSGNWTEGSILNGSSTASGDGASSIYANVSKPSSVIPVYFSNKILDNSIPGCENLTLSHDKKGATVTVFTKDVDSSYISACTNMHQTLKLDNTVLFDTLYGGSVSSTYNNKGITRIDEMYTAKDGTKFYKSFGVYYSDSSNTKITYTFIPVTSSVIQLQAAFVRFNSDDSWEILACGETDASSGTSIELDSNVTDFQYTHKIALVLFNAYSVSAAYTSDGKCQISGIDPFTHYN